MLTSNKQFNSNLCVPQIIPSIIINDSLLVFQNYLIHIYFIVQNWNLFSSMLKFLDNRTHQKPPKSPKKYQPQMLYGISAEAPQTFQTPFTIVHKQTYVSPYLPFEENRKRSLPQSKQRFQPDWTKKTNLHLIEEQKILSTELEKGNHEGELSPSRYKQSYYEEFNKNSSGRFKLTRGEFTNFIEKNNHYKSIGPLHGDERTENRIEETKKSVWLKPDITRSSHFTKNFTVGANSSLNQTKSSKYQKNSTPYSTYFDHMRNSIGSLIQTNTSLSKNSKLLSEKARIRGNRQQINHTFQRDLYQRKKSSPYHKKFQLPKLQSEIQISNSPNKIMPDGTIMNSVKDLKELRSRELKNRELLEKNETGMQNLDQFQIKLWRKFK